MRLGTGVAMCKARSLEQPHNPPRDHPARVPAGDASARLWRIRSNLQSSIGLSGYAGQAWKGVLLRHIACITTASLRATAAAACLKPIRFASAPGLEGRVLPHADQQTGGSLKQIGSHQPIAAPGDASGPIRLA